MVLLLPDASLRSAIWTLKERSYFRVVPQRYKTFYTSAAERDITEKLMYIMQQYRDTALAERWDNAFAL